MQFEQQKPINHTLFWELRDVVVNTYLQLLYIRDIDFYYPWYYMLSNKLYYVSCMVINICLVVPFVYLGYFTLHLSMIITYTITIIKSTNAQTHAFDY